jgi:hypothetical protein
MNLLYDPATLPAPEPNPLARKLGVLVGKTCQGCVHLTRLTYHEKNYYKCLQRGKPRHSAANDHRRKWNACKLYQEDKSL